MPDHECDEPLDPRLPNLPLHLPLSPDLARWRIAKFWGVRDHEALYRLLEDAVEGLLTLYHGLRPLDAITIRLNDGTSVTVARAIPAFAW